MIQHGRTEILTLSIRREMDRPKYVAGNTFIPQLVRTLCHTYDFRDLRNINKPISYKAIYNQAIAIWNELNDPDTLSGLK